MVIHLYQQMDDYWWFMMINDDIWGIQRSLLGFAAMHAPPWICRATVPAGLQPTHNHLLDVCFKVSSFKELIKMTVLQRTMMAPAAAMPDKTGMEDCTSPQSWSCTNCIPHLWSARWGQRSENKGTYVFWANAWVIKCPHWTSPNH